MRAARHLAIALCALLWPGVTAAAECRLALALALDVSGSVDAREYRLQLDGLAAAVESPSVQSAALAVPGAEVALAVYEWGGPGQQRLLVNWTALRGPADLRRIARHLRGTSSLHDDPDTAIGQAMLFGAELLARRPGCWRHVLDVSGDGPSNRGPHPRDLSTSALSGVTVNGLVIGPAGRANVTKDLSRVKSLLDYYRTFVSRGPGAFVETARDFDDFRAAMTRKLVREMRPAAVSQLPAPAHQ
ncbi:DUF1194 domain-containing protein [Roseovarius salinarum]|uniref:DUF1194 domain-containing protein n=1 Tax=Roseovarius salinarum TaxID=1981892 RepID=UPI001E5C9068|nr:DUF1194 domain-containing protein [Roseovarius salinarum]